MPSPDQTACRSPRSIEPVRSLSLLLAGGAALFMACSSSDDQPVVGPVDCPPTSTLSWDNFGGPFFLNWCTGCHSSALGPGARQNAPLGVNFDQIEGIRVHKDAIDERAVHDTLMPPAGGPNTEQRRLLGEWLACGAPGEPKSLSATGPSDVPPAPTGSCAQRREPLPASLLPRCSAATFACVMNCAAAADPDACGDACTAGDTTPPGNYYGYPVNCSTCRVLQLLACGERSGCHDPIAAALCCSDAKCPPGSPEGCGETRCPAEFRALGLCLGYAADECVSYSSADVSSCFAH